MRAEVHTYVMNLKYTVMDILSVLKRLWDYACDRGMQQTTNSVKSKLSPPLHYITNFNLRRCYIAAIIFLLYIHSCICIIQVKKQHAFTNMT